MWTVSLPPPPFHAFVGWLWPSHKRATDASYSWFTYGLPVTISGGRTTSTHRKGSRVCWGQELTGQIKIKTRVPLANCSPVSTTIWTDCYRPTSVFVLSVKVYAYNRHNTCFVVCGRCDGSRPVECDQLINVPHCSSKRLLHRRPIKAVSFNVIWTRIKLRSNYPASWIVAQLPK